MANGIWLNPGILTAYGRRMVAESHRHNAIQVVWPQRHALASVGNCRMTGCAIIGSGVQHALTMDAGWVLLVEPQSAVGVTLASHLDGRALVMVDHLADFGDEPPSGTSFPAGALAPLVTALGITPPQDERGFGAGAGRVSDPRINALLLRLDRCFQSECLKPPQWRAVDVAAGLALSESRFLHLFREQMGIAWRPYLLWRRLLCAVTALASGITATAAAHQAGFADSAHLSRTFRSVFGMSIREASRVFRR